MSYRLLCISEQYAKPIPAIRVEVCLEGNSKTIAPFQRKVTLSDIQKSGISTSNELISLLNHAGLSTQPFRIPHRLLENPLVQHVIICHPYNFVESAPKGSIKKGQIKLPSNNQTDKIEIGRLIGGELYISNINSYKYNNNKRVDESSSNLYIYFHSNF